MKGAKPALLGLFLASLIVATGTLWAFERGGHDFAVFYEAWRLVLTGHGAEVYATGPDRFLYAPGFAWLLCPIALLPQELALALWCFAKAGVVGFVIRDWGLKLLPRDRLAALGLGAWAVVLIARPILVDLQYGQVNILILGACVWALLGRYSPARPGAADAVRWAVLAVAAVTKIFPLPLLVIPFLVTAAIDSRRLRFERLGVAVGLALALLAPALTEGLGGLAALYVHWQQALVAKGLPLESHNQSFAALLHHYFSGAPTPVISSGMEPLRLGFAWLPEQTITQLSLAWTLITSGLLLGWILSGESKAPLQWVAVTLALLVIPSHLVWKPYFVMGLPAAILVCYQLYGRWEYLVPLFAGINLVGFDFVGRTMGARFEAASWFLLMHLLLVVLVCKRYRGVGAA